MTPLLEISDLTLSLRDERGGEKEILAGVGLSVSGGQAVAVVGESGAGKSMTARSILRLLPEGAHVGGHIAFDGRSVLEFDRASLRRFRGQDVAMIFQDAHAHLNPVRTIDDFLCEALVSTRGVARREASKQATELLRKVGIVDAERVQRQFPHQLSGGMLQRTMIAAGLAISPRLIIADEPTTALDVTTQQEFMRILLDLREQAGLALLFVTHDLALATATCDVTVVMYAGRVVEERASARIATEPRHPYTAALFASQPSIEGRSAPLRPIAGRPQSASEVDTACAFAPRCPLRQDVCLTKRPPLREVDEGKVACHFAEALRGAGAALGSRAHE